MLSADAALRAGPRTPDPLCRQVAPRGPWIEHTMYGSEFSDKPIIPVLRERGLELDQRMQSAINMIAAATPKAPGLRALDHRMNDCDLFLALLKLNSVALRVLDINVGTVESSS